MKSMEFIRWGGLSPVIQNRYVSINRLERNRSELDDVPGIGAYYHSPPAKKGIWAFIPGYIEMFLVSWKIYKCDKDGNYSLKKEFNHARKFSYSGKLWTHIYEINPEITYYRSRGSWYETDTDSLGYIIKLHKWNLSKEITSKNMDMFSRIEVDSFDEFINAWKIYSKDEFEIFIERVK